MCSYLTNSSFLVSNNCYVLLYMWLIYSSVSAGTIRSIWPWSEPWMNNGELYIIFLLLYLYMIGFHVILKHCLESMYHIALFYSYPVRTLTINTLLAKKVVTPPLMTIKPMWIELCVSTWLKLACHGPVIVPQRNPTPPWADIQCKVKWDRRAPKPQYRWSFPQINLHTVTTLNQFFCFSDCSNNAPSNPYGY